MSDAVSRKVAGKLREYLLAGGRSRHRIDLILVPESVIREMSDELDPPLPEIRLWILEDQSQFPKCVWATHIPDQRNWMEYVPREGGGERAG